MVKKRVLVFIFKNFEVYMTIFPNFLSIRIKQYILKILRLKYILLHLVTLFMHLPNAFVASVLRLLIGCIRV